MAAEEGEKNKTTMITLKSFDGKEFVIEQAVAMQSQTLRHMIEEDDCADNCIVIPVPNVHSNILSKVIDCCKKHAPPATVVKAESNDVVGTASSSATSSNASDDEDIKTWDAEFVQVDQATLLDLIMAANYLNIKGLLDLICRTVVNMIKGKTPEQIRQTFNIKNDFTPEEEAEIRRKNPWAFI